MSDYRNSNRLVAISLSAVFILPTVNNFLLSSHCENSFPCIALGFSNLCSIEKASLPYLRVIIPFHLLSVFNKLLLECAVYSLTTLEGILVLGSLSFDFPLTAHPAASQLAFELIHFKGYFRLVFSFIKVGLLIILIFTLISHLLSVWPVITSICFLKRGRQLPFEFL